MTASDRHTAICAECGLPFETAVSGTPPLTCRRRVCHRAALGRLRATQRQVRRLIVRMTRTAARAQLESRLMAEALQTKNGQQPQRRSA